jgi:hypothetical protein
VYCTVAMVEAVVEAAVEAVVEAVVEADCGVVLVLVKVVPLWYVLEL